MVLDVALLYAQYNKVRIKDKVEQSRECSSAPLHLSVVSIEKGACESPSTNVVNFTLLESSILREKMEQILREYGRLIKKLLLL